MKPKRFNLKRYREAKGLTFAELARQVLCTEDALRRCEKGHRLPKIPDYRRRLLLALGLNEDGVVPAEAPALQQAPSAESGTEPVSWSPRKMVSAG